MGDHFFTHLGEYQIQPGCTIGFKYKEGCSPVLLGRDACIRIGTIIYADVTVGDDFQAGHNVLIRENTIIGNHVAVGTNTVIDGNCTFGDFVKIASNCYIPTHCILGNMIFLGPGVIMTNDRYPLKMRDRYKPDGPILKDGVTIGGGSVICPGVCLGENSFVAAGTVVTKDVPANSLVRGVPGEILPLPEKLQEKNLALSWRKFLDG